MAEQDLEVLYRQAQAAIKARDYAHASELLKQILLEDHDYKDVPRLLATTVKLRRRRWYNHPLLWKTIGAAIVIGLGFAIAPRLREVAEIQPSISPASPTGTSAPTDTLIPTGTPVPTSTPIPLVWKRLYVGQEFAHDTVAWFGMDPKDKDVLYVGMENAGTYQSIDGGLSWQPIKPSDIVNVTKFDLDWEFGDGGLQFIRHTAADGRERIYYVYQGGSWFVSENGGQNRREFYIGGTVTSTIAFSPDGEPYLLCDQNICKFSPDGKQRTMLGKPDIGMVEIIVISPYEPNTIFAGGVGLAISHDGGLTWTKANNGLGATILKLDKAIGSQGALFLQMGECYIDWFANPNRQKMEQPLYRSEDGGRTWNLLAKTGCSLAMDNDGKTLYRHGVPFGHGGYDQRIGFIWRSQDGGRTWQKQSTGPAVYVMIANPFQTGEIMLFAGADWFYTETPDRQFFSQNYGETWNTFDLTIENFDFGGGNTYFVQYGPVPDLIYLVPQYQDIYRSEDNGIVWEHCANPFDSNDREKQLLITPLNRGQHLLVAQTLNEVYESKDGCKSWTLITFYMGNQMTVNTLALDSNDPNTVYAGTDSGAYISLDFGHTWNQINDGLLGATVVYSIVVDKDSNVYAATPYGIFKLESR